MNALPLIDRELRTGARRPGTYWIRSGVAAAVCVIWLLILAASSGATPVYAKSLILFWTVTVLAFGFCLFAGVFLTADCISGEKRDGTLGLLFLTHLQGHDVVLGKLVGTSLHAAYSLLGAMPVLALPLLIGGVGLGEFWRAVVVLGLTLFLSLAIGLAISVVSREVRQAMAGTLIVLTGLAGALPLVWWVAGTFVPGGKGAFHVLLLACPPCGLAFATDALYHAGDGARNFGAFLCVQIGLSVLALTIAGVGAPRIWTERQEPSGQGHSVLWRWFRFGSTATQRLRHKAIEENPFYWLASRDRLSFMVAWAVVGVLFVLWSLFLAYSVNAAGTRREVCLAAAAFLAYGAFVLWKSFVAIEASRRLSEDRQNGVLELLLVTPLMVEQLITGQRRALNRVFLGPGLAVVLVNVVFLGRAAGANSKGAMHGSFVLSLFFFCVGGLLLAGDLGALTYTGMWIGLRARRLHRALLGMFVRVMLGPLLGVAFFAVTLISGTRLSADGMYFMLCGWVVINLIVDAAVGVDAKDRLDKEFRLAACGDTPSPREASGGAMTDPQYRFRSA